MKKKIIKKLKMKSGAIIEVKGKEENVKEVILYLKANIKGLKIQ